MSSRERVDVGKGAKSQVVITQAPHALDIADVRSHVSLDIHVDRAVVKRYLGAAGKELTPDLEARVEAGIRACESQVKASFVYKAFSFDSLPLTLLGTDIQNHLADSVGCVFLACTLGVSCDQFIRMRAIKSPLDSLIFDTAASAYIEEVANVCEAAIVTKAAGENLLVNGRFSPGYGDFPLTLQHEFLDAVDAQRKIGLSVTESSMLNPTKSITACLGLFDSRDAAGMHTDLYPQRLCASCVCHDYCYLRKAKTPCYL